MTKVAVGTTQRPHIETLSVNVQVIRIGQRQMTQAVFRQLPYSDWVTGWFVPPPEGCRLDTQATQGGILWGHVAYYWQYCCEESVLRSYGKYFGAGAHWHLVWQKGETLYRCGIPFECPRKFWTKRTSYGEQNLYDKALIDQLVNHWEALRVTIHDAGQLFIAV